MYSDFSIFSTTFCSRTGLLTCSKRLPWLTNKDSANSKMEQRCVNCALDISRMQRHSLESEEIRTLIQQWIAPQQVADNSLLCHSCWMQVNAIIVGHIPENRSVGHAYVCFNCGCSIRRIRNHLLRDDTEREQRIRSIVAAWHQPRIITESSRICHPCWQRADRASITYSEAVPSQHTDTDQAPIHSSEPSSSSNVTDRHTRVVEIYLPNYTRASNTERHCLFFRCTETERLRVPTSIRVRLFCDYSFYIPPNCRICNFHLRGNAWEELTNIENANHMFTAEYIEDYTSLLKSQTSNNIDFENIGESDDHLVFYWLGLSKIQFRELLQALPRLNNSHRGPTGLAAYLVKLRTGDSDQRLSSLFKIPRSTLERLMSNARDILHQDFVPANLGLQHMTREDIIRRNLTIPNGLFGSIQQKPIVIMDGTYIYVQKSANYCYQKETYSLHKYRNLVKPFIIVCCDGYIVEVLGPYPATTSDAQILINEFREETQPLRSFFNPGDVFILDRGFRDAIPLLEECGYSPQIPASLEEGETQLSTIASNKTRTVTISRWIVEYVNGIFKQSFKIFRQEFFNRASMHMMVDVSNAAALINKFHAKISDREDAESILAIINDRMHQQNTLGDYVIEYNLNRRWSHFVNITVGSDNLNDFPRLTMSELLLISCGPYQIRQSRSYYGEHIRASGTYTVEVCREANNLPGDFIQNNCWILRGRIQSRHIGRKVYYVYILINNNYTGRGSIQQYYCNCIAGRRTVGCCAHVMTIIWYVGWARFEQNITPPAQILDNVLCHCNEIQDE